MRCLDGPAEGRSFNAQRAPLFLRVVRDQNGKWDVLDQLDDQPAGDETIFIYRKVAGTGGHACTRGQGCYEMGDYRHLAAADVDQARDTEEWRDLCRRLDEPVAAP
jgi:hypothetical protein